MLDDQEIGFMGWAIFAVGAAIGIWWWLNRQAEQAEQAAEAEQAMREAEAKAAELNAAAQASLQTPTPATDVVEQVGEAGVDDASDAVEDAAETVAETAKDAGDAVEDTAADVAETAKDAGDAVEDAAADVAETAEEVAEDVSNAVEAENSTANPDTDRDAGSDDTDGTSLERDAEPGETVEAETPGTDIDTDEDAPVDTTSKQTDEVVEPTELKKEDRVDSTVDGEPDDLTKVEGIGPYYQRILHESDITTFAGLATLSESEIAQLIQDAGGRRSNTIATWAEQAALAAAGDWEGLAKLQDELIGGRRG
ncbi:MAG: hypothetical protein ACPG7F_18385 [Aggregatilineales bacterium]